MAQDAMRNRYLQDGAGVMSQPKLLIMLYDRLILDLEQALEGLTNNEWELVNRKLLNAQAIVLELHSALDKNAWSGGESLGQLYEYFDYELTMANVSKSAKHIKPVLKMMRELRNTWNTAHENVLSEQAAARAKALETSKVFGTAAAQ